MQFYGLWLVLCVTLVACHIRCTFSTGMLSQQHYFVSILQPDNNRCSHYRLQLCREVFWSPYVGFLAAWSLVVWENATVMGWDFCQSNTLPFCKATLTSISIWTMDQMNMCNASGVAHTDGPDWWQLFWSTLTALIHFQQQQQQQQQAGSCFQWESSDKLSVCYQLSTREQTDSPTFTWLEHQYFRIPQSPRLLLMLLFSHQISVHGNDAMLYAPGTYWRSRQTNRWQHITRVTAGHSTLCCIFGLLSASSGRLAVQLVAGLAGSLPGQGAQSIGGLLLFTPQATEPGSASSQWAPPDQDWTQPPRPTETSLTTDYNEEVICSGCDQDSKTRQARTAEAWRGRGVREGLASACRGRVYPCLSQWMGTYFDQKRAGDCWYSEKTKQDGFGECFCWVWTECVIWWANSVI